MLRDLLAMFFPFCVCLIFYILPRHLCSCFWPSFSGSSVAVERIFSSGRDTISIHRSCLKPETISRLMLFRQKLIHEAPNWLDIPYIVNLVSTLLNWYIQCVFCVFLTAARIYTPDPAIRAWKNTRVRVSSDSSPRCVCVYARSRALSTSSPPLFSIFCSIFCTSLQTYCASILMNF